MTSHPISERVNVRQVIPRDAIPSVDDPAFGSEYDGDPGDLVVAVDSADPPRAYPIRYLRFHEIVNDDVGGGSAGDADPIAVTWCPLCGSAAVYDRQRGGRTLEFGVSGKLADDDLVMYDRETGSEWKQSSGECLSGAFAGESLSVRPAAVLPWESFRATYPDGVALRPPGGESEAAGAGDDPEPIDYDDAPYAEYLASDGFGLAAHRGTDAGRTWDRDDLDPKAVVLGVDVDDDALGFPLPRVRAAGGVVRATVGDRPVVAFADDAAGVHAYADPGHAFERTDAGVVADGTTWDVATGRAADDRRLERVSTRRLFAFAWRDDHGDDAFYTVE
jgi:hypothetical protein